MASLLLAALYLLQQRNLKRMLAYSSVEHMGILAIAVGFGSPWRSSARCCTSCVTPPRRAPRSWAPACWRTSSDRRNWRICAER
ncbi:proton-conducting transporter transmembrane domain-containing protein [Tsukamurella soli]|uniref:proton-conducting transporter transmembrane domain-containing protein n=1 Tax=Tsukamurella soli TaxID=644556 RepID=UPI0036139F1C